MSSLLEHSPSWRTKDFGREGKLLFSTSSQERQEKSYGNSKEMGRDLKHAPSLDKRTSGEWEYFSKKWHHPGEREIGKGQGSKVLTYINEQAVCPRDSQELGLKNSVPFSGSPKDSVPRKMGLSSLSAEQSRVWRRRLGNTRDKGSENPALKLSLGKLRSPRIMECHCS